MIEKVKPGYHGASWGTGPRLAFPPLLANPPRAGQDIGPLTTDLIVACVNVGTKFPSYYVDRLFNSVCRNLTIPFRFQVLTDVRRDNYETINPLAQVKVDRPALTSWYSKINLFSPTAFPAGVRVLYLDLDVVITGSLDELAMCREPFVMIREFAGNTVNAAHNSSVMSWTVPYAADVFTQFEDEWMNRSWGDQECIWTIMGNDRIWDWPEHWVRSYKYHPGTPQPHTKVMVFHGDPKPDAVSDNWVIENWR